MRQQITDIFLGKRAAVLSVLYIVLIAVSIYFAYEIRFDFLVPVEHQNERLRVLLLVIPVKLAALLMARQMGSMITFFGVPDLFRLTSSLLLSAGVLIMPRFLGLGAYSPPRGVLLIDFLVCLAGFCSLRLGARLFRERIVMGKKMRGRILERVVIIGAGSTGASLAAYLTNMPARGIRPVAFLDDDPTKHGKTIHGIPVVGAPESFQSILLLEDVVHAIIAMPSASIKRVREIALFFGRLGVRVETVPALEDLASGRARVNRIRPIEIQDLLGRTSVVLDTNSIKNLVGNKVVLVTGAGGSIGSELCRQIAQLNPRRLLMVDRSEPALFMIEQELSNSGLSGAALPLVADISDSARMNLIFETHSPQVVFHAAAHKHVFLMERQPAEAIKNNAIGTRKLAMMAIAHGVETFVFISTDKAVNPTNVMGASKRLAELHLQSLHSLLFGREEVIPRGLISRQGEYVAPHSLNASEHPSRIYLDQLCSQDLRSLDTQNSVDLLLSSKTKLMAVRFGNVLGSSGSVVPIFKRQIEAGGPVTVTHPDVTRYFMTIPEAVGLVLQASVLGRGGEIFVLDMGQPIKIVDLARNMIELSGLKVGEDIEIAFVGLKLGEKLYEELQHSTEQYTPTEHPKIMRFIGASGAITASKIAIEELEPFVDTLSANELKRTLKLVIPEYNPSLE